MPIVSQTGQGSTGGDVAIGSTLGAFGPTMLAACGVAYGVISPQISTGSVVPGALAS
jgi:hypothetical protein